jgi:uridine phosphorylase
MAFPNYPNKHNEKSFLHAQDFWKYKKELGIFPEITPPKGVIICYSPSFIDFIVQNYSLSKVDNVFGKKFYLLNDYDKKIAICWAMGVGAPITGILIEELSAFGVKKFVSMGVAGSLQKNIQLGSTVICTKAIRDEGTSHHYALTEKYAYPSRGLTEKLIETAKEMELNYHTGTTWTTDAPYRETIAEINHYKDEGVLTVEMEASAVFTIAKVLNIDAGAIFTISDYLSEDNWELHFHLTEEHMHTLFLLTVKTLNSLIL